MTRFILALSILCTPAAFAAAPTSVIAVDGDSEQLTLAVLDGPALLDGFALTALYDDGESTEFYSSDCVPNVEDEVLDCEGLPPLDVEVDFDVERAVTLLNIDIGPIVFDDITEVGIVTSEATWVDTGIFWTHWECKLEDGDQETCEQYFSSHSYCNDVKAKAVVVGGNCLLACNCGGGDVFPTTDGEPMPSVDDISPET